MKHAPFPTLNLNITDLVMDSAGTYVPDMATPTASLLPMAAPAAPVVSPGQPMQMQAAVPATLAPSPPAHTVTHAPHRYQTQAGPQQSGGATSSLGQQVLSAGLEVVELLGQACFGILRGVGYAMADAIAPPAARVDPNADRYAAIRAMPMGATLPMHQQNMSDMSPAKAKAPPGQAAQAYKGNMLEIGNRAPQLALPPIQPMLQLPPMMPTLSLPGMK